MKVLHVITGLDVGGAEQQLRLLLRHLDVDSEVVVLTGSGPLADAIRRDGVRVTELRMGGNRDLRALPRLVGAIRAARPDIVHTHLYRACVYGRPAARLAGVRTVVATEHSLGAGQIEGRPLTRGTRALYRATERLGHGTIAVSPSVAARLGAWGVRAGRVHLAPNGIEPARFAYDRAARARVREGLGIPRDAFVVGGVGRQVPGKRFDVLVRAVAQHPGAHLLLAGDGIERVALLRLVQDLRVQDRVRVVDPSTTGVPELLSAMDVFASPSADEAFGLAVVEALASGLPVLYSACPAVEDLPAGEAPGARRIAAEPPGEPSGEPDRDASGVPDRDASGKPSGKPSRDPSGDPSREPSGKPSPEPDDRLVARYAEAIGAELAAGQRRLPPAPAVARYDITRTAQQVMAVYERTHHRRGLLRRLRPAPTAGVPAQQTAPAAHSAPDESGTVPAPASRPAPLSPPASPSPSPSPSAGSPAAPAQQ